MFLIRTLAGSVLPGRLGVCVQVAEVPAHGTTELSVVRMSGTSLAISLVLFLTSPGKDISGRLLLAYKVPYLAVLYMLCRWIFFIPFSLLTSAL